MSGVEALIALGMGEEALRRLEPSDSNDDVVLLRATAAWNVGETETALRILEPITARPRPRAEAQRLRAWMLFQSVRTRGALLAALEAADVLSDDPATIALVGLAAIEEGDRANARRAATELVRILPGSGKAHELAGHVALAEGRWSQADAQYGAALQADPSLFQAHLHRAEAQHRIRRDADAIQSALEAHRLEPSNLRAVGMVIESVRRYLTWDRYRIAFAFAGLVISLLAAAVGVHMIGIALGWAVALLAAVIHHRRRRAEIPEAALNAYRASGLRSGDLRRVAWRSFLYSSFIGLPIAYGLGHPTYGLGERAVAAGVGVLVFVVAAFFLWIERVRMLRPTHAALRDF